MTMKFQEVKRETRRQEDWKIGRLEGWKKAVFHPSILPPFPSFLSYFIGIITLCFFFGCFDLASAQVADEEFRATADVFLRQLTSAEHQGMGGSFTASIAGANALNSNPAGLSFVDSNRFVAHIARVPRTVAVISRLNASERYEDYGRYDLRASGLELMNYIVPMGRLGVIGFDLAFEYEGRFSRVNHLGKATTNFPESNLDRKSVV